MQTIPYQRLQPVDLYHMLDWVRDSWDGEELEMTQRLQRLRWHLEELPEPFRSRALKHYTIVTHSRIVNNQPWRAAIVAISGIVAAWGESLTASAARS